MADALERLWDRLRIAEGDLILLHTAFTRIQAVAGTPRELIESLRRRLGTHGTLVMPRYAWHLAPDARPWKGYAEFMRTLPPMDLRHTPANIGAVPEVFRQMNDVVVSISHFWPVAAIGPRAADLTQGQESIAHAYGTESVFARLVDCGATIVGLGVTLNTSSLAPVTDLRLDLPGRSDVFTDEPVPGVVIDLDGALHRPAVVTMRPEAVRDIKPSRIMADVLRPATDFPFAEEGGNFFFSYPARLYHETAVTEGRAALRQGQALPWLT